jgi:ribonuclease HI
MTVPAPHFHLYAEAAQTAEPTAAGSGRWRFVLRQPCGESTLEAADDEPAASQERLELLAIVRGLEALDQPSRVTLKSCSRQISRGLQFGLPQWREDDWQWERYGRMTPVKNGDLWQRLDRLLEIHVVQCRPLQLDKADDLAAPRRTAPSCELPPRKHRRCVLRVDDAHGAAKHQIASTKSQTISKSKTRFRNVPSSAPSGHWRFSFLSLLGACHSMLGFLRLKRR